MVASKVALNYLASLAQRSFQQLAVKGGDTVDLGGGHVMEFVMAPNLHWPDTMFSYDRATRVMYTCDAFGLHYCAEVRIFTLTAATAVLFSGEPQRKTILTWCVLEEVGSLAAADTE